MNVPVGLIDSWASLALTIAWQLAALAALVWLCERVLRLRQPRPRHALWWFVLLAPLALAPGRLALARNQAVVTVAPPGPVARIVAVAQLPRAPAPALESVVSEPLTASAAADPSPASWWSRVRPVHVVALLWLVGVALLALRLVAGHCRVRGMLARAKPVTDPDTRAALTALAAEAGVRRQVQLRSSDRVAAPLLYGWRRPVVLLPADWLADLSPHDLRALLAHEIAHVRRRDFLANLLQRLTEALLFFHPATWLASRRISLAREELCDAWALRRGADAGSYARSLASAAERAHARFAMASVGVAESRFTLLRRVEAIMGADSLKKLRGPVVVILAAVILTAVAVVAAVTVGERPAPQPDDAVPVTVLSGDVALTARQLSTVLGAAGIRAERYTYSYPHPHGLHFSQEEYVDGARATGSVRECWISMDPGENTLLLLARRQGDGLGFQFAHGGSSASTSSACTLEGYDSSTQGPLAGVVFAEGERVPIYVFAANRSGIEGLDLRDDLQTITSAYDKVIVVFAELQRQDEFAAATGGGRAADSSLTPHAALPAEASEVLTNMKNIALAIEMWIMDHDGTLPPTRDTAAVIDLLEGYVETQRVFMRPSSDEVIVQFVFEPGARADTIANRGQTPIAIADYHPDFVSVAYLDGHVKNHAKNAPVMGGGGTGARSAAVAPAMLRAARAAEASEVLSNMKQIALAFQMWLTDHDETLPPTNDTTAVMELLREYVQNQQVFTRPSTDDVVTEFVFEPGSRPAAVPNPSQTPVAIVDYHPDFRAIGYLDGHAETHWKDGRAAGRGAEPTAATATVLWVRDDKVFLNVGTRAGVRPGTKLEAIRDGERIGLVEVTESEPNGSYAKVVSGPAPRTGDQLRVLPEPPAAGGGMGGGGGGRRGGMGGGGMGGGGGGMGGGGGGGMGGGRGGRMGGGGGGGRADARGEPRQTIDEAKHANVMAHADEIRQAARRLFDSIRTADYDYFLRRSAVSRDFWHEFPIFGHYMTHTDYPTLVKWICRTFKDNPIVSVELGDVFLTPKSFLTLTQLPAVPYKLTLKDGAVLEGNLPFAYYIGDPNPHWHGLEGIDWHLQGQD